MITSDVLYSSSEKIWIVVKILFSMDIVWYIYFLSFFNNRFLQTFEYTISLKTRDKKALY